ncbi:putative leucine-rich repeat domain superfamily [Helianthus annuus]|uniref:Leucine-rich repeat domain superfamily n=2 Tax=Helianthus annuus TaxID=4232 RepID=A0A9K3JF90_HELAN|nr:F-box/LRR-repeat protein 2 [Helianthus annuus]XP_022027628.1 F-box/LRR-repeat protein 2 [Helianthus annuus]KAF5813460.1 putative leucine-rich repeat domain superfamily [Helianthus annuus]
MESDQNLKIKQVSNLSGTKRGNEESSDDSVSVNKKNKDSVNLEFEFDLNASIEEENCVDDVEKHNQFVHGFDLNGPVNEVIDISSDDNDDDDKKLVNSSLFDLHLGFENGSFVERKYTKEEKGKAKVDDFLSLSLTSEVQQADTLYEAPELNSRETSEPIAATTSSTVHPQVLKQVLQIPKNQEKKGGDYSHLGSVYDFLNKMVDSDKTSKACGELKAVIDQITKREAEKLIDWSPCRVDFRPSVVPSLLDLSLDVLVKNADAISSFDHVPEWLKRKLINLLCDTHRMDIHILELLFKDSPSEIRVKNCSWMTQQQLTQTLGNSCLQNLRVLQLDYCGQCSFDDIIPNSLARSPNSLPFLGILSLKGAARLSDNTLKPLFISAPLLQSINLSQCTLLTHTAIKHMVSHLKNNLKELYIDECPRIDAHLSSRLIIELEHLEVLSIAGIETVCDEFVVLVVVSLGDKLKELNLAGCVMLTNSCLKSIGYYCPNLCHLNLSHLCRLTDLGLCYLAAGCKSLKSLNVARTDFSDELIAAFLETSGKSLKELSLNHVSKVSFNTAFSLAKFSKDLVSLDVSWCRELTDEAIGFITDNCSSLKLLKVFGCTQLTESFLLGHANSQVSIVGRNLSLMDRVNMLEPDEILLRHSALKTPENGL